jgi:hypothetical protein
VHHSKVNSEISGSDFFNSGELLEKNYAKTMQSRELTNILKMHENLKLGFRLLFILRLTNKAHKKFQNHITVFRGYNTDNNEEQTQ